MQSTLERPRIESEQFDRDKRRYYDTVTWLAEVLPGSMRTPFEYQFDGRELYANDGSALKKIFNDSIEQARNLPVYEQRRRQIEKEEYQEMIAMMRDDRMNTMVVVSDFPPELMSATEDVGGYNVTRKQTMLRVLAKTPEGTLRMYSQSLDGSNRQALEGIYAELGYEPAEGELLGQRMHVQLTEAEQKNLVDRLMGVYDRGLARQFGGDWYAGERSGRRINTFDFACQQQDLLRAYLSTTDWFTGGEADYNLAAAVLARFENRAVRQPVFIAPQTGYTGYPIAAHAMALAEMNGAGVAARREGVVVSGCGATISMESTNTGGRAEDQLQEAGFGNQSDKLADDKYGSRYFKCPKKSCSFVNERPENTLLPTCKKCGTDVSCREPAETRKTFLEIIENSFGKQKKLRQAGLEEKSWLN